MAKNFAVAHAEKGVTIAQATGIAQSILDGLKLCFEIYDGNESVYYAVWDTGTLTLSDFNAFPIGSIIIDVVGFTYNAKVDATTWKSETLS